MQSIIGMHSLIYGLKNTMINMNNHIHYIGDLKYSVRSADFDGWLMCDGRSVSRASYPELFEVIGTAFGSEDEESFNLPNCGGRVTGCIGTSTGALHNLGDLVGAEQHQLTENEMPSHTHTGTTVSSGGHNHGGSTSANGSHNHGGLTSYNGDHNHGGSTGATGSAPESESAAAGGDVVVAGENTHTHTIATDGSHAHTITTDGSHAHTIGTDGAHTHAFTTNATGGNASFDIMQPTIFVGNMFVYAGNFMVTPVSA